MIALVQPWTPGQTWALLAAVIAIAALVSLALCRLMARHTRPADDGRIYRYGQGTSLSWNDETPAELGGRRGSADTHSRKG